MGTKELAFRNVGEGDTLHEALAGAARLQGPGFLSMAGSVNRTGGSVGKQASSWEAASSS